jgi:soluble lytic murein transglycosylase-like protein
MKSYGWTFFLLAFAVLAVASAPAAHADFYTYEDDEGVVHLTNVPIESNVRYRLILREKRVLFDRRLFVDITRYDNLIIRAAQKYKMDKALIKAVIKAESNFNHHAVSPKGARGLMQLMPTTAAQLQVKDSFHPEKNIEGGVRYLRYLLQRFNGNLSLALAAYNAGEKAVTRYRGIPPYRETQNYVERVQSYIAMFR